MIPKNMITLLLASTKWQTSKEIIKALQSSRGSLTTTTV